MESKKLEDEIECIANKFLELSVGKEILVLSHFDTDGITSATILTQTLKKLDKRFSVKILKRLEDDEIFKLPKDRLIIFLDLASGSLDQIVKANLKDVFIIDHHEIIQEIPSCVHIVNPFLNGKD
ncbi:Uncharacterised protein [uncultured archaeon]|nr:Uncharacterised protein [uncultured archaeon]